MQQPERIFTTRERQQIYAERNVEGLILIARREPGFTFVWDQSIHDSWVTVYYRGERVQYFPRTGRALFLDRGRASYTFTAYELLRALRDGTLMSKEHHRNG